MGLLVTALLAVGAFAVYEFLPANGGKQSDATAADLTTVIADGSLTQKELTSLDPQGLFFTVFKNAAQKPIAGITQWRSNPYSVTGNSLIYDTVFDFETKQLSYQYQVNMPSKGSEGFQRHRCVEGVMHTRVDMPGNPGEWEKDNPNDSIVCGSPGRAKVGNTDRMNTGGLTKEQADTFVSEIIDTGTVSVKKTELVEKNGKQLVRFAVELSPVFEDKVGEYYGIQELAWAFQKTGLDPGNHPYTTIGAGKQGLRMILYADPVTALPVYSQSINTPGLTSDGKWLPSEETSQHPVRVEYAFPDKVPALTLDEAKSKPLAMTWPEEPFPPTGPEWKP